MKPVYQILFFLFSLSVQRITSAATDDQEQGVCVSVTEEKERVLTYSGGSSESRIV